MQKKETTICCILTSIVCLLITTWDIVRIISLVSLFVNIYILTKIKKGFLYDKK